MGSITASQDQVVAFNKKDDAINGAHGFAYRQQLWEIYRPVVSPPN